MIFREVWVDHKGWLTLKGAVPWSRAIALPIIGILHFVFF